MNQAAGSQQPKPIGQLDAVKYYSKVFLRQSKFAWAILVGNTAGMVIQWEIPALMTSNVIDKIQSGADADYPLEIAKIAAVVLAGIIITRIAHWHKVRIDADGWGEIQTTSLTNLLRKSMDFHTDTFAGSNAGKINTMASGFTTFSSLAMDDYLPTIGSMAFVVYVLGSEGGIGIVFLSILTVINFTATYAFVKRRKVHPIAG